MNLPIIFPEIKGQLYDCECCGSGCRELVIFLTERDYRKIDEQGWAARLDRPPYIRLGRSYVLNHKANGECVFLTADNRCRIHAEFGYTEKPLSCQLFPFTLERDAEGFRVGLRFDCPAMAKSVGGPLAKHRGDVARLAAEFAAADLAELKPSSRPVELVAGRSLDPPVVERLIDQVDRWIRRTDVLLAQRLSGLVGFLDTLSTARLGALDNQQVLELVELLMGELPSAARDATPVAPATPRQLRLLRQAVFAHCENIPLEQASAGVLSRLRYRWGQLRRARAVAAGVGAVPTLLRGVSGASFDEVEHVEASESLLPAEADGLLTRYLRARLAGGTVFGRGFFGWPIVEGLRALILAVAVVGWLARYLAAADRRATYTMSDLVRAVGIVDRNATRNPEVGASSGRLRLRYLSADDGLRRLLAEYPVGPAA